MLTCLTVLAAVLRSDAGTCTRHQSRIKTHLAGFDQGKEQKPVRTTVNGHILTILPGAKFAKGFFGNRDLAFTEAYAAVSARLHLALR